ncbi:MAG: hypothetical protein KJP00_15385 [Bacteroidia bacterium]|nr:hypothetical protein [Bacteroidia bacterium]
MKHLLWLMLFALFIYSCNNQESKKQTISQDDLVAIVCQCGEILISYNDELQKLAASDDMSALSERMQEGDTKLKETLACVGSQVDNSLDKSIFSGITPKIQERCSMDIRMSNDLIRKLEEIMIN